MADDDNTDYLAIALEQRLAELNDTEFDALVARTRPPKLSPQEAAAEKVNQYFEQFRINLKTDK
jgi:hypothetical protein